MSFNATSELTRLPALEYAAGDAVAGVAGGVAHVVVDAGVDDDGGAVAVEQLIVDCQVGVEHFDGQLAGGRHVDVGHVAGVRAALGMGPVLGVVRVGRAAAGGEGRRAEAGGGPGTGRG